MNRAAAHLVTELEEKLVELEGLQGKQRTQHVETERTGSNNTASDLLHEDRESQRRRTNDHKSPRKTSEQPQEQHTLCVPLELWMIKSSLVHHSLGDSRRTRRVWPVLLCRTG